MAGLVRAALNVTKVTVRMAIISLNILAEVVVWLMRVSPIMALGFGLHD